MILRGLASVVVVGLLALNMMLPTAKVSARGSDDQVRADFETEIVIGQRLPPLDLFDMSGRRYSREDLLGHRVLLTFERSVDW